MTYILAWRDKKNVYVTGDSALTITDPSQRQIDNVKARNRPKTSFGEKTHVSDDQIVEEAILKIETIKDNIIFGYAGNAEIIREIIDELSEEQWKKDDLAMTIKSVTQRLGGDCQFVIGYRDKRSSVLISFNLYERQKVRYHKKNRPILLGNIRSDLILRRFSSEITTLFKYYSLNLSPEKKLVATSALMQLIILRAEFISKGVGGSFIGAYVGKFGFRWQEDTGIIQFDLPSSTENLYYNNNGVPPFSNPRFTGLIFRGRKLAILLPAPEKGRAKVTVFGQYLGKVYSNNSRDQIRESYHNWRTLYWDEVQEVVQNFSYKYIVFFFSDERAPLKITIIDCKAMETISHYSFRWTPNGLELDLSRSLTKEINPFNSAHVAEIHWLP